MNGLVSTQRSATIREGLRGICVRRVARRELERVLPAIGAGKRQLSTVRAPKNAVP